jgi:branched-chain amino acid transport system ATP-binding protein
MLEIDGLSAWYGEAQALRDVSLRAAPGEIVTLVGRNGAGKTTALRCVMGLHRGMRGSVRLGDADLGPLGPALRARAGIGYVPDDRGIYATLTVHEHLILPAKLSASAWDLDRVYAAFPALRERRRQSASKLSGGEQQMLAIARVLRMGARLLLLDEPTEGLAPILVQQIAAILRDAKAEGRTVLLVEQNLRFATGVADRHYLLSQGAIVATLRNDDVRSRESEVLQHLGI